VFYADGGTGAIVAALGKLMEEEGVDIRLKTTVHTIVIEGGAATGVRLKDGAMVPADLVVSDADPMHLFGDMIPARDQGITARLKHKTARLSMGLFVLYFGTGRQYPDLARHTIWLGKRYKGLLNDIFHKKVLAEDFSLYVHRPTATDPSFAPEGCDAFYALCPVPNLKADIDWRKEAPLLRDRIVAGLQRTILPGLSETIRAEITVTPEYFKSAYLSHAGAGFSIAPHFTQSAFFRFHNKAEGIRNLYLTGAGTHPGAGIPGVICSAKVVDRLIPQVAA
jgi:phytoene desaturase